MSEHESEVVRRNFELLVKVTPHVGQATTRSPVCVRTCSVSFAGVGSSFPHNSHLQLYLLPLLSLPSSLRFSLFALDGLLALLLAETDFLLAFTFEVLLADNSDTSAFCSSRKESQSTEVEGESLPSRCTSNPRSSTRTSSVVF